LKYFKYIKTNINEGFAQKSYLKFPAEEADNVVVSELADIRQCNKLNKNASLLEYGLGIHSSSFGGDNEDATKLLIVIARASLLSTKPKTITTTGRGNFR
jgi:cobalamin biosynthesis protein CbiD